MRLLLPPLRGVLFSIASVGALLFSTATLAAELVVLQYRILRESIPIDELTALAETGELSASLQANLELAGQDPQEVRRYLTAPAKVSPVLLDRLLNSPVGNVLLDQVSQAIHPPSGKADRQAMRAALVLSASDDREVSLIEIMQKYPTQVVEVEGDRLESAYYQLRRLEGTLENILGAIASE